MSKFKNNKLAFVNARLIDPGNKIDTIGIVLIENKIIKR